MVAFLARVNRNALGGPMAFSLVKRCRNIHGHIVVDCTVVLQVARYSDIVLSITKHEVRLISLRFSSDECELASIEGLRLVRVVI